MVKRNYLGRRIGTSLKAVGLAAMLSLPFYSGSSNAEAPQRAPTFRTLPDVVVDDFQPEGFTDDVNFFINLGREDGNYPTVNSLTEALEYPTSPGTRRYVRVFSGDWGQEVTGSPPILRVPPRTNIVNQEVSPRPQGDCSEGLIPYDESCPKIYPRLDTQGNTYVWGIVSFGGINPMYHETGVIDTFDEIWLQGPENFDDDSSRGFTPGYSGAILNNSVVTGWRYGVATNYGLEMNNNFIDGNAYGFLSEDFGLVSGGDDVYVRNEFGNVGYIGVQGSLLQPQGLNSEDLVRSIERRHWHDLGDSTELLTDPPLVVQKTFKDVNEGGGRFLPSRGSVAFSAPFRFDIDPLNAFYHSQYVPLAKAEHWEGYE